MKVQILAATALLLASTTSSFADENDIMKLAATSLVKKAVTFVKSTPREEAMAEINKEGNRFANGDLYVFVYDTAGVLVANPNPNLKPSVGKNLLEKPDADGKFFRKEMVAKAKSAGTGWVDYKNKNPKTDELEDKSSYFVRDGDLIICCGIYKGAKITEK